MDLKQATRGLDWYSLTIGKCDMSDFVPRRLVMYQNVCFFSFLVFPSLLAAVRFGEVWVCYAGCTLGPMGDAYPWVSRTWDGR